jgi:hypothetical protein
MPFLQISVVKEIFDNAELIRLTANQSTAQAYAELQHRAERIIQRLRYGRQGFIEELRPQLGGTLYCA